MSVKSFYLEIILSKVLINYYYFFFQVEYEVKPCKKTNGDGCVDVKKKSLMMPFNGYIVYGAAHQHAGGIGAALYREVIKVKSGFCFKLMD